MKHNEPGPKRYGYISTVLCSLQYLPSIPALEKAFRSWGACYRYLDIFILCRINDQPQHQLLSSSKPPTSAIMTPPTTGQISRRALPSRSTIALNNINKHWDISDVADVIPKHLHPQNEHDSNRWNVNFQIAVEAISRVAHDYELSKFQEYCRRVVHRRRYKNLSRCKYLTLVDLGRIEKMFRDKRDWEEKDLREKEERKRAWEEEEKARMKVQEQAAEAVALVHFLSMQDFEAGLTKQDPNKPWSLT
jgi:hypothetical protein